MGASNFIDEATGNTAQKAYDNAREEARDRNGHQDGYSGDIQTTSGFKMVTLKPGQEFEDLEDEVLDNGRDFPKWGNCACLDLGKGLYRFFGWAAE